MSSSHPSQDGVERLEDGDLGAEVGQERSELAPDDAAADDDDRGRQLLEVEELVGRHDQAAVDLEARQRAGHRARRQHDVAADDDPAGILAVDHLDAAAVLSVPVPDRVVTLRPLSSPDRPLNSLSTTAFLRSWLTEKSTADVRDVDRRTPRRRRWCGGRRPSRGTPWPGCSHGAGTSRRPCPARRWPPRGPPRRRRAPWRTRPAHRRSRRCRTRPRVAMDRPLPAVLTRSVRRARPPRNIPIAPAGVLSAPVRAAGAAYRSRSRPGAGRRRRGLGSTRSRRCPNRPPAWPARPPGRSTGHPSDP